MKMTAENFSTFKNGIQKFFEDHMTRSYKSVEISYVEGGLTPMRCRWDILWKVKSMKYFPEYFIEDVLYKENNLNDEHIDTALKMIVKEL